MYVGEICRLTVRTVGARESVRDAAGKMMEQEVGSLVVLDGNGDVVGIVTDRDLAMRVLSVSQRDSENALVEDVMTRSPATVHVRDPLESALALMENRSCRRLPVFDSHEELVGIISLDDLLQHFGNQLDRVRRLLISESPDPDSDVQGREKALKARWDANGL